MVRLRMHRESHLISSGLWLRAASLAANDGIVPTARLRVGIADAATHLSAVLVAVVTSMPADSMSMARVVRNFR